MRGPQSCLAPLVPVAGRFNSCDEVELPVEVELQSCLATLVPVAGSRNSCDEVELPVEVKLPPPPLLFARLRRFSFLCVDPSDEVELPTPPLLFARLRRFSFLCVCSSGDSNARASLFCVAADFRDFDVVRGVVPFFFVVVDPSDEVEVPTLLLFARLQLVSLRVCSSREPNARCSVTLVAPELAVLR